MVKLKIVIDLSKGSLLTGNAWANVLLGGIQVIERAPVTANFNSDPNSVTPNQIEFETEDWDGTTHLTLTIVNCPESIGPIQTYGIAFYVNDQQLNLNWQTAIKGKPLRFGGQPSVVITNPHVGDEKFKGWCSVRDISPGMSITWGLQDLINSDA